MYGNKFCLFLHKIFIIEFKKSFLSKITFQFFYMFEWLFLETNSKIKYDFPTINCIHALRYLFGVFFYIAEKKCYLFNMKRGKLAIFFWFYFILWGFFSVIFLEFVSFTFPNRNCNAIILINREKCLKFRSECDSSIIEKGRSYTNSNININKCYFERFSIFNENGGVIFVESDGYVAIIINTVFFSATTEMKGGAIYFASLKSYLRNVCAFKCKANGFFHFSLFQTLSNNEAHFLSMIKCAPYIAGMYSLSFYNGQQNLTNMNISDNSCERYSGFDTTHSSFLTIDYCNIANNEEFYGSCIIFSGKHGELHHSNIIGNECPTDGVIFILQGSFNIMNSVFCKNLKILFQNNIGTLHVSKCFISHTSLISEGDVDMQSNNYTQTSTIAIFHYASAQCYADNPIPIDTPSITTSSQTQASGRSNQEEIVLIVMSFIGLLAFFIIVICIMCKKQTSMNHEIQVTRNINIEFG